MVPDIRKPTHGNQHSDSVRLTFLDVNRNGNLCFLISLIKNLPSLQEIQVQSLGQEDPLEKGMVTHSSILAWRISWNLACSSPWGHKRVGHNWTTETWAPLFSVLCYHTNPKAFPNEPPIPMECLWSVFPAATGLYVYETTSHAASFSPSSGFVSISPSERETLEDKDWCLSLHHQGGHYMVCAQQECLQVEWIISALFVRVSRMWESMELSFSWERGLDQWFSKFGP